MSPSSCASQLFSLRYAPQSVLFGISQSFDQLSPTKRQVTHVLLTRSLLEVLLLLVQLACIRHAASVNPEPGSNSLIALYFFRFRFFYLNYCLLTFLFSFQRSISSFITGFPVTPNHINTISNHLSTVFFNFFIFFDIFFIFH